MKPFTSLEATRSGCWWRAFEHLKKKKFARAAQREQIRSASRLHFIVVAGAVKKCSSSPLRGGLSAGTTATFLLERFL
jgi:hypothetical protein